jgi:hypothetical protein
MTNIFFDHLVTVYCYTDTKQFLHRNNVCFFGNQAKISDGWNKSREQNYTGGTVITIYWIYIEQFIVSVIQ